MVVSGGQEVCSIRCGSPIRSVRSCPDRTVCPVGLRFVSGTLFRSPLYMGLNGLAVLTSARFLCIYFFKHFGQCFAVVNQCLQLRQIFRVGGFRNPKFQIAVPAIFFLQVRESVLPASLFYLVLEINGLTASGLCLNYPSDGCF